MANVLGNRTKKPEVVAVESTPTPVTPPPQPETSVSDDLLVASSNKRVSKKDLVSAKLGLAKRSLTQPTNPIPRRNNKRITYYENNLLDNERKRDAHGTTVTIPFFIEEYRAIEELFKKEGSKLGTDSITNLMRQVILAKAKSSLGAEEFNKIINEELNQRIEDL